MVFELWAGEVRSATMSHVVRQYSFDHFPVAANVVRRKSFASIKYVGVGFLVGLWQISKAVIGPLLPFSVVVVVVVNIYNQEDCINDRSLHGCLIHVVDRELLVDQGDQGRGPGPDAQRNDDTAAATTFLQA